MYIRVCAHPNQKMSLCIHMQIETHKNTHEIHL